MGRTTFEAWRPPDRDTSADAFALPWPGNLRGRLRCMSVCGSRPGLWRRYTKWPGAAACRKAI